jgi:hypothetical protein
METFEGLEPNAQSLFTLRHTEKDCLSINKEETII